MIYNDKKFDLMLESAWRAFESTLMLHGMSKEEVEDFKAVEFYYHQPRKYIYNALESSVKWEDE